MRGALMVMMMLSSTDVVVACCLVRLLLMGSGASRWPCGLRPGWCSVGGVAVTPSCVCERRRRMRSGRQMRVSLSDIATEGLSMQ